MNIALDYVILSKLSSDFVPGLYTNFHLFPALEHSLTLSFHTLNHTFFAEPYLWEYRKAQSLFSSLLCSVFLNNLLKNGLSNMMSIMD